MTISSTTEWKNLQAAFDKFRGLTLRNEFSNDPNRFEKYNIKFNMPGNGGNYYCIINSVILIDYYRNVI